MRCCGGVHVKRDCAPYMYADKNSSSDLESLVQVCDPYIQFLENCVENLLLTYRYMSENKQ